MYSYKLPWKIRYIFTSLAAVVVVTAIWAFKDVEHDGPFKVLLFILAVNAISWLVSYWREPSGFKVLGSGIKIHYPLKQDITIQWVEMLGLNHLSSKKSKNGFGQEELEIKLENSSINIVKCLKKYTEFESMLVAKLNS